MSETIIGIDLGTTNSEVAVIQDGKVVVIEDNGKQLLPSFVGMSESGELLVGEAAKNQYALYPERTIKSIKRRMGEDVLVDMAGQTYSPQEVSAIILKRLKAIAEAHLGHSVSKAVITVPAYFSDAQRQATHEAGKIAGLDVVRMINEPTAAALTYESEDQQTHRQVVVYDLGGGTFDVSVVNIENGVVEVIASHGNNHLGGDDFDQKIIEFLQEKLQDEHTLDVSENRKTMARLARAAETAKLTLSSEPYALIEEEYVGESKGKPIHLSVELSRHNYEEMIEDYIDETLEAVHIALRDAKLTASDIDKVLLVGGSTRTPIVRERLFKEFGMEPHSEVHPDLCVAMGAAVQGGMVGGADVATVLVDVTPYTYGTSVFDELDGQVTPFKYAPIIHKNTSLPATRSEVFATMVDGQKVVHVKIFQGEDPDALNNILIGDFHVEGLQDVPAGNPILLSLDLDLNGILKVSAKEKESGLEKHITIENALSRMEGEDLAQAQARLNAIFGEDASIGRGSDDIEDGEIIADETQEHHEIAKAKALAEKAQRLLDQASSEDREDMVNLIESIREAIEEEDFEQLSAAVEALSDILYYLET
jgi:molecular chaperone DnaK (HSP70)